MKLLLASLLFAACTKTDAGTSAAPPADPAPAAAAPVAAAPVAAAPAPTPAPAPAAAPAPAPVAEAEEPAPDLVEAAPGVQVVADYDAPVFYEGGQYWRENGGRWYSSARYTGGWEYRVTPPTAIVHIDRPERFVHYRPSGYVVRHRPAPQREWHPEVHADVRVEAPREVRVAPPRAEVHVEAPRAEVHVNVPRVHVEVPRAEVRIGR